MVREVRLIVFVFGFLFIASCVRDKPVTPDISNIPNHGEKIWVANEGSLGNGNASLSIIFPGKDSIYNQVFASKNNQVLGDVLQSMALVGNRMFLAVNNSDVIKVIDKNSFQLLGEVPVTKPRYLLPVDSAKMYVSSLFYPEINIINPQSLTVTGSIPTDFPNTEGLLDFGGSVYACNWDTTCNYIYEINPQNDQIAHRIPISGYAPQQVLADKEGKLWVIAGNVEKGKSATITRLDPATRNIIASFHFPQAADILKPCWNAGKDTLYFLGVDYSGGAGYNGVFRMSINAQTAPVLPLIQAKPLQYFWALGIDSSSGKIYVGDPKGFIQKGSILVYNSKGTLLKTYTTGLGPGFFLFENK